MERLSYWFLVITEVRKVRCYVWITYEKAVNIRIQIGNACKSCPQRFQRQLTLVNVLIQRQKWRLLPYLRFRRLEENSNVSIVCLSVYAEKQSLIWKRIGNFIFAHWILAKWIDRNIWSWWRWRTYHFDFLGRNYYWLWRSGIVG